MTQNTNCTQASQKKIMVIGFAHLTFDGIIQ